MKQTHKLEIIFDLEVITNQKGKVIRYLINPKNMEVIY